MTKGSGDARTQPLYFLITTAGTDTHSICYEAHTKALDRVRAACESARQNPAGNITLDKVKSTEKIDVAVDLIMGINRAIRCGNTSGYDQRGLLVL